MIDSDRRKVALRPSNQKRNIGHRIYTAGQQKDPSDKRINIITDSTSGVLKDPVDGEGASAMSLGDTHAFPSSVPRAQKGGVDDKNTDADAMRLTQNATVDVTYGSKNPP